MFPQYLQTFQNIPEEILFLFTMDIGYSSYIFKSNCLRDLTILREWSFSPYGMDIDRVEQNKHLAW